ncbi:MAG: LPXTG cell wall anchor domain-containing protein, partial [Erysipelotrichaceae bacterium]|nr:LPXTG cell wall anchor domain-containing protein [Erysipelotrichaceae bacterium]
AVGTGVSTNHAAANWNDTQPIGEDETEVFNYKFDIKKYDASDESKETLLEGAKFKLYDNNQALINLVAENGYYRVATPEEAAKEGFASAVPVTDANGYFQIKGLSNGTYWLEETEAPKGFNKLTSKVSFEINGSDKIGSAAIEVANNKGKELPSTGGMGTTIFYTVGGILVVGAAVLLITKKRMDGAQ